MKPIDLEDDLFFAPEEAEREIVRGGKWKVLVVDDDREIHEITRMVIGDLTFEGKGIELMSAHSGEEARRLILQNPDTAVILLDVVMEEDDAGLKVVKYIREELKNPLVRIILRTGQPGQAPEARVIIDYDINDYKEKTELTSQKLFTSLVTALRSFRDLSIIEANHRGLEKIVASSANIFELQSLKNFASGVLTQLTSILHLDQNALYCKASSFAATKSEDGFLILAATGEFRDGVDRRLEEAVSPEVRLRLEEVYRKKESFYSDRFLIVFFRSKTGSENMIYLEGFGQLGKIDRHLVEAFCTNVSIAFDNIYLNEEIENTQREIIFTLGEIAEARSHETGNHVKRVAEYCGVLAKSLGLSPEEVELIKLASPMHDLGKLAVPDAILNKPGKLSSEEFEVIKTHSFSGHEMLKNSTRQIMSAAAIIALQHHEKYNGKGYPQGLKGEGIHLYGRITAIADVFDALGSERVYKKAWEFERILELFREERGEHFDPELIDCFFENLEAIVEIRETFLD